MVKTVTPETTEKQRLASKIKDGIESTLLVVAGVGLIVGTELLSKIDPRGVKQFMIEHNFGSPEE